MCQSYWLQGYTSNTYNTKLAIGEDGGEEG